MHKPARLTRGVADGRTPRARQLGHADIAELVRDALVTAAAHVGPAETEDLVVAELFALHSLALRLLLRIASGQRLTPAEVRQLVVRVAADKKRLAAQWLERTATFANVTPPDINFRR